MAPDPLNFAVFSCSFGKQGEYLYREPLLHMPPIKLNPDIDAYLKQGCGRCDLFATPACKVNRWRPELELLRSLLLESGLHEELKWSVPCYTFQNKNVLIMAAFKDYCSLNFFKGSLLTDPKGLLSKAGENSNAGRQLRFTSVDEVLALQTPIQAFLREAMEIERSGRKVESKAPDIAYPEELKQAFEQAPELDAAFHALTPGRRRAYLLHFSSAKQAATRSSRIAACRERILAGKGLND